MCSVTTEFEFKSRSLDFRIPNCALSIALTLVVYDNSSSKCTHQFGASRTPTFARAFKASAVPNIYLRPKSVTSIKYAYNSELESFGYTYSSHFQRQNCRRNSTHHGISMQEEYPQYAKPF